MVRTRTPFWIWLTALILGVLIFGFGLLIIWALKPEETLAANPTAVITVISAPTTTPTSPADILLQATPTSKPLSVSIGGISIDTFVQITGTGGDGLRLRKDAGIEAPVLFLGYEAEVFRVVDGPKEVDGIIWWYLTAPYDKNRSGWAASNFLNVVEVTP